jgi:putative SOS response-associated peptidase YedK
MRWGLIPWWNKPGGRKLPLAINARAETLATNGMFKEPFQRRRFLVISDGDYKWRKNEDGSTTPFRIGMTDWTPFGMAVVWDLWKGPDRVVRSCSVITTTPNALNSHVHDRIPVILPRDAYGKWLDLDFHDTDALSRLLVPYENDAMTMYEISPAIGNVKNDTPDLIELFS